MVNNENKRYIGQSYGRTTYKFDQNGHRERNYNQPRRKYFQNAYPHRKDYNRGNPINTNTAYRYQRNNHEQRGMDYKVNKIDMSKNGVYYQGQEKREIKQEKH